MAQAFATFSLPRAKTEGKITTKSYGGRKKNFTSGLCFNFSYLTLLKHHIFGSCLRRWDFSVSIYQYECHKFKRSAKFSSLMMSSSSQLVKWNLWSVINSVGWAMLCWTSKLTLTFDKRAWNEILLEGKKCWVPNLKNLCSSLTFCGFNGRNYFPFIRTMNNFVAFII